MFKLSLIMVTFLMVHGANINSMTGCGYPLFHSSMQIKFHVGENSKSGCPRNEWFFQNSIVFGLFFIICQSEYHKVLCIILTFIQPKFDQIWGCVLYFYTEQVFECCRNMTTNILYYASCMFIKNTLFLILFPYIILLILAHHCSLHQTVLTSVFAIMWSATCWLFMWSIGQCLYLTTSSVRSIHLSHVGLYSLSTCRKISNNYDLI